MAGTVTPRVASYSIGEPGSAARVEGTPAMLVGQQPDAMLDAGQVGALTIRAGSVRGAGHRYDGTPRQDDFCFGTAGPADEWLVAVVADGVSAGVRSHIAARVAVRLGVQLVGEALEAGPPETIAWDPLVGTIAGHVLLQARKDQGDESLDAGAASRIMATTAAFVILPVDADADGSRVATVLPIGDTSVWVLRASGSWDSVTPIKNEGEAIASSAVFALPLLPSSSLMASTTRLDPGDAIFVVTDGIGDPLGDGTGEVGQALARVWASPPNRYEFLAQVDFGRRSHTDDRTVVAVWPDQVDDREAPPSGGSATEPGPDAVQLAPAPAPAPAPASASAPTLLPDGGGAGAPDPDPWAPVPPLPEPDLGTEPSGWEPTPWEPTPWNPEPGGHR